MIYLMCGTSSTETRFKSLTAVRRWATRYQHAWRNEGPSVIVSTADGKVFIYQFSARRRSHGEIEMASTG